jgi:predicted ArsR family transcriptional regulator
MTRRSTSPQQDIYRALSSPVRSRLLELLRDEPDLDTATLAEHLDLHINTVRTHLNVLEEAGLVQAVVEERSRAGRPKLLYQAVDDDQQPAPVTDAAGYRFLASILASYLGGAFDDSTAAAEQAGRAWGGFVVDKPAPFSKLDAAEAIDRLVTMLDDFGFAPELDERNPSSPELVLRRCPFLDVAREHQEVVCSIHLGLMRGALDELGVDVQARDLIPWASPDACVAHLRIGAGTT